MRLLVLCFAWLVASVAEGGLVVSAQSASPPLARVEASHSTAALYAEHTALEKGGRLWIALRFEPREGWHTYWKNPGDSGAAPAFNWDLPNGVSISEPLFGVPDALPYGPLLNYGYKGASSLLYEVSLDADADLKSETIRLAASGEWLVCDVECIPQFGEIEAELPVGTPLDAGHTAIFHAARANLPDPPYWEAELRLTDEISRLIVFMTEAEAERVGSARFFPVEDGVTEYAAEQRFFASMEGLFIDLPRYAGALTPSSGDGILVLHLDGERLEVRIEAPALDAADVAARAAGDEGRVQDASGLPAQALPLWQASIFAFFGGLILNLMPCVFPVLSLKALSLVRAGDGNLAAMRRDGWAYTAGIIASFAVIVAGLVALRSGGAAIGWGFQLQEPLFVAALVVVMVLVGLSLSGLFEISTGLEGKGQSLTTGGGARSAFFTGVLATLVATPCTAPFMAPAVGFALAQPGYVIALVFFMLAFGLAFPFLALSYVPALARLMPKPGPWMETLKQFLAFPMYATAVWLLSVFGAQVGSFGMSLLLGVLVLIVFALWLAKNGGLIARGAGALVAVAAVVLFVQFDLNRAPAPRPDGAQAGASGIWSADRVAALRSDDQAVFAYFTADWCITCKVNERVALFRDETMALFEDRNITVLKADWTNKNAEIAAVLADHGRAGVPLYLYYAPGAEDPVILPEILTPGVIRDAVS